MQKIEITNTRLQELLNAESENLKYHKRFGELDKVTQDILIKLERYEKALNTLTWKYGCVSPESMRMKDIAKNALYPKK